MTTLKQILYRYGLNFSNPLRVALKTWLQQKKGYYSGDTYKTAYKVIDELLEELFND